MSDDEEDEGPAVPLGEGEPVEGAPAARVASRLHYPIEKSAVLRREGETTIRTPDGPRELADVLEASDEVYFDRRQSFEAAVREVVGLGPVPTAGGDGTAAGAEDEQSEAEDEQAQAGDGQTQAGDGQTQAGDEQTQAEDE